ncbi:heavy metal translocating P-type ATPase metal-binding domain-containing protein, partial [Arthrospira platensis SPKY1]|nr:heavy metal translocating P-type ATPase metal-binding domain-containing protein [Arthrospira platensis SPKY1]
MTDCKHCGTPFSPVISKEDEFCCHGCAAVYRLIHDQGFEQYYALKEDRIDPVRPSVLEERDYQWLQRAQKGAETEALASASTAQITLDLMGISCMGCVWLVEKLFLRCEGAVRAEVNAQYGQMRLHWRVGTLDLTEYARQLQRFGYLLA